MSQFVCPQLVETWKGSKIKAYHEKESCHTGLVGPKNVPSVGQYLKLVPVGPKNGRLGPKLETKPSQGSS